MKPYTIPMPTTADLLAEADRLADAYEEGYRDGMTGVLRTFGPTFNLPAWGLYIRGRQFGQKLRGDA